MFRKFNPSISLVIALAMLLMVFPAGIGFASDDSQPGLGISGVPGIIPYSTSPLGSVVVTQGGNHVTSVNLAPGEDITVRVVITAGAGLVFRTTAFTNHTGLLDVKTNGIIQSVVGEGTDITNFSMSASSYSFDWKIIGVAAGSTDIDIGMQGNRYNPNQTTGLNVLDTITVNVATATLTAPAFTTAAGVLMEGTVNAAYSTTIAATGSPAPTFAVTGGALPDGLTLNAVTGVISGTPAVANDFSFTIKATNTQDAVSRSFSIKINAAQPPVITTTSLPNGTIGNVYSQTLAANHGPVTSWTVIGGALPDGLTLNAGTGVISGTPATANTYNFKVKAENANGNDEKYLSITISDAVVLPAKHIDMKWVGVSNTALSWDVLGDNPGTHDYIYVIKDRTAHVWVHIAPQGGLAKFSEAITSGHVGAISGWFNASPTAGVTLGNFYRANGTPIFDERVRFSINVDFDTVFPDPYDAAMPYKSLYLEPTIANAAWSGGATVPVTPLEIRVFHPNHTIEPVVHIAISPTSSNALPIAMDPDGTRQLTATVNGRAGDSPATIDKLIWSTTNSGVATVDADGLVTAVGPGSVVIGAQSYLNPTISASAVIQVSGEIPAKGLTINPSSATISVDAGDTRFPLLWALNGQYRDSHPRQWVVEPEYTDVLEIDWMESREVNIHYGSDNLVNMHQNNGPVYSTPQPSVNNFWNPLANSTNEGNGNLISFTNTADTTGPVRLGQPNGYQYRVMTATVSATPQLRSEMQEGEVRWIEASFITVLGREVTEIADTNVGRGHGANWGPRGDIETSKLLIKVTRPGPATMSADLGYERANAPGTLLLSPVFYPPLTTNRAMIWLSSDPTIARINDNGIVTGVSPGTVTITGISVANPELTAVTTITVDASGVVPATSVTMSHSPRLELEAPPSVASVPTDPAVTGSAVNLWFRRIDGVNGVGGLNNESTNWVDTTTLRLNPGSSATIAMRVETSVALGQNTANVLGGYKYAFETAFPGFEFDFTAFRRDGSSGDPQMRGVADMTVTAKSGTTTGYYPARPDFTTTPAGVAGQGIFNGSARPAPNTLGTELTFIVTDNVIPPPRVYYIKEQLTAMVYPANATTKNIIWGSSDVSVAIIDVNGYIEALKPGMVLLTARSTQNPVIHDTAVVIVGDPASYTVPRTVTFNPNGGTIPAGEETRIVTGGDPVGPLPVPTHPQGYTFLGWHLVRGELTADHPFRSHQIGEFPIKASMPVIADTTFHARWMQPDSSGGGGEEPGEPGEVFVPVSYITSVPTIAMAGTPLTLTGTVVPGNATNKTIAWTAIDAGDTGATIANGTLNTTAAGTVFVRAAIAGGINQGAGNFGQDFTINVIHNNANENDRGSGSSGDNDRGSDGRSINTGSGITLSTPSPVTVQAANTATQNALAAAVTAAAKNATATLRNASEISLATLKSMASIAAQAGMASFQIQADSMTVTGAVDVRITLDPSLATQNLNLHASTVSAQANQVTTHFEIYFQNKLMTVNLGQQGSFGQNVRIAAKLGPGLNTDNLYFYAYNSVTNTYMLLATPNYWIDPNGYVHFTTSLADNIIVSNESLARKLTNVQ